MKYLRDSGSNQNTATEAPGTGIGHELDMPRAAADLSRTRPSLLSSSLGRTDQTHRNIQITPNSLIDGLPRWWDYFNVYPRRSKAESAEILDRLTGQIQPISNELMTARLVRELRSWVYRGLIKPGERLPPERHLASSLDVSRTSLRIALRALQLMGVLEIKHGSGTYLARGSKAILSQPQNLLVPLRGISFAEVFEARRAVEMEAAAGAALRATEDNLRKLNRELELMQATLADPAAYLKHDLAFHRNIAIASGNSVFLWFFELVSKVIKDAWAARSRTSKLNETLSEHRTIAKAIEMRDPDGARYAMLKHLMLSKFYSDEQLEIELRVVSNSNIEGTKPKRARRLKIEENRSPSL